jgi:hypothetical protein
MDLATKNFAAIGPVLLYTEVFWVKFKSPIAIQILPFAALKIGARMLGQWDILLTVTRYGKGHSDEK